MTFVARYDDTKQVAHPRTATSSTPTFFFASENSPYVHGAANFCFCDRRRGDGPRIVGPAIGRYVCDIICEESVTAQPSPHVVFTGTEAAAWSRVYARHASALQRSWWLSSCQCRHRHLSSNVEFDATPRTRQWAVDDPVRSVQGGHWHLQALLLHASLAAH